MREQTRHRYFNSRVFVRVRRSSFARRTATVLSGFDAGPLDAKLCSSSLGPIAQLDRASGYEPGGRRFESCWAHLPRFARQVAPSSPREAPRLAASPLLASGSESCSAESAAIRGFAAPRERFRVLPAR